VAEYYAIGHDNAESLIDPAEVSSQDSVSLMFCGSGDARHLFATLLTLQAREMKQKRPVCKDVHITILDLKPAALARTLVMFDMLCMYVSLKTSKVPGHEDAPAIMAYIYAGHVVPAVVNEKLQVHIAGLITALDAGEPLFDDWFFMPAATRKDVAQCLRRW